MMPNIIEKRAFHVYVAGQTATLPLPGRNRAGRSLLARISCPIASAGAHTGGTGATPLTPPPVLRKRCTTIAAVGRKGKVRVIFLKAGFREILQRATLGGSTRGTFRLDRAARKGKVLFLVFHLGKAEKFLEHFTFVLPILWTFIGDCFLEKRLEITLLHVTDLAVVLLRSCS